MPQKTGGMEIGGEQVRLPTGVVLRPPITAEDLRADTEYDPEGADEFVALIRSLRREGPRPNALE